MKSIGWMVGHKQLCCSLTRLISTEIYQQKLYKIVFSPYSVFCQLTRFSLHRKTKEFLVLFKATVHMVAQMVQNSVSFTICVQS